MRRYLLDTGIAGAYVSRRRKVFDRAHAEVARGNRIGIGLPVLGELCYGVEYSATRERKLKRLKYAVSKLTLWPFTAEAAAEFGRIAAMLRRMGRPMQTVDMQIAAIAFSLGNCTVVSTDSDLRAIPGLDVENWM
jgi:tRNA(fMet)-specific endonuclease VapC